MWKNDEQDEQESPKDTVPKFISIKKIKKIFKLQLNAPGPAFGAFAHCGLNHQIHHLPIFFCQFLFGWTFPFASICADPR
jgi:hypothetical protein